jgi:hypothetical protein
MELKNVASKYGFEYKKTEYSSEFLKYIKGEKYVLYQGVSLVNDELEIVTYYSKDIAHGRTIQISSGTLEEVDSFLKQELREKKLKKILK